MNSLLQSTSFVDSIWAVTKMHLFNECTEWVCQKMYVSRRCIVMNSLLQSTSFVDSTWAVTKMHLFSEHTEQVHL